MNTQQIFTSIPYDQLLNDLTERITQAIPPVQVLPPPTQEHPNDLITRKETATLLGILCQPSALMEFRRKTKGILHQYKSHEIKK